jgi:hypothetical protein
VISWFFKVCVSNGSTCVWPLRRGIVEFGDDKQSGGGPYKLRIQLTHSLKAPGFNPWALWSENLVSKFAFKWVNLHRYNAEKKQLRSKKREDRWGCIQVELNAVDP